jgi:hypothetical protein
VELLHAADPKGVMYVKILTTTQLGIGANPLQHSSVIDLAREEIRSAAAEPLTAVDDADSRVAPTVSPPSQRQPRRTGKYLLSFKGTDYDCLSLKHMLAEFLKAAEKHHPGTLENLSHVQPRTKKIVARNRSDLSNVPEKLDEFAEELMPGWWYWTNNSADETVSWIKRGCTSAHLRFDHDVVVVIG